VTHSFYARRWLIRVAALTLACGLGHLATPAWSQTYPSHSIRVVLPFTAGGTTDFLARISAKYLSEQFGQPVVVDNRPGAGGNLGSDIVAKAAPDGYTLGFFPSSNLVQNPFLMTSVPFDPLNDFSCVFNLGHGPQFIIVPSSLPVKTLADFIALAKSKPGALNYASAGNGSSPHLAGDLFARLAGVEMVHIPYKGVSAAIPDLVAGRVQMLSVSLQPVRTQIESGELRALALAANKRMAALPNVPTAAEAGLPGYEVTTWFGYLAPHGTDGRIVQTLNAALQKFLGLPETERQLADAGVVPIGGSTAEFTALLKADYAKWGDIIKKSGIKLDQ
jgi:tripartite-type tricarboxylate transporter receptor subunit TctC